MILRKFGVVVVAMALAVGCEYTSARQREERPPPPAAADAQGGIEAQTRGPVHEAFAEPTETRPVPSPVVPKQPPEPIEEMPPDQKPQGDNVVWIAGYWGWDPDQNDYLWVSGFWRDTPPDRQWVPGHWQQVQEGWQWSAGFWAAANLQEIDYHPPPPPSIDNGPTSAAPDDQSIYVPGCWIYRETRYLWRPGFWMAARPDWVWIPAHYVWTPVGCIFVDGYWDYPLHERGLLFCPIRFAAGFTVRPGFVYTPQYVVQPDFLFAALFVHPASCHYYFGDFFDNRYSRLGFVTWIDYRINRFGLDPNFAYYRYAAGDKAWETHLRAIYDGRRRGEIPLPPRTLTQQTQIINNITTNVTQNTVIKNVNITQTQLASALVPLNQAQNMKITNLVATASTARGAPTPVKTVHLERVDAARLNQAKIGAQQHQALAVHRGDVEAKVLSEGKAPTRHTDPGHQMKLDLPRSTGRPTTQPQPPARGQETKPPTTTPPGRVQEEKPPARGSETKPPTQPPTRREEEKPPARGQETKPPATQPPQQPPARNLEGQRNRQPPPPPTIPRHEEKQVPPHEPLPPSRPPNKPPKDQKDQEKKG
jgi:hypothetical protein